jgi:hypothetical protein
MMKSAVRERAWAFLLGAAIVSIVAGIKPGGTEEIVSFLIRAREPGPMASWMFFLLSISIGYCIDRLNSHPIAAIAWLGLLRSAYQSITASPTASR